MNRFNLVMLAMVVWVMETLCSTWPNTTLAEQPVETHKFAMNGYTRAEITKLVRNEASGNLYYYGQVYNTGNLD